MRKSQGIRAPGMMLDCVPGKGPTAADLDQLARFRECLEATQEYIQQGMTERAAKIAACLRVYGTPFGD